MAEDAKKDETKEAAKKEDGTNLRTIGEDGQPLLDVKISKLDTTVHGSKPKVAADDKKRSEKKEAPISTVAQLRDKGLEAGVMPASSQVEEVRKSENEALVKLGEEHRPPAAERGKK